MECFCWTRFACFDIILLYMTVPLAPLETDQTPRSAETDLGLTCLLMSHKKGR